MPWAFVVGGVALLGVLIWPLASSETGPSAPTPTPPPIAAPPPEPDPSPESAPSPERAPAPESDPPVEPSPMPTPAPEPEAAPPPAPEAAPAMATLSVNAVPWGEVSVDGRDVGTTPQRRVSVRPGEHTLVVRCPPLGREVRTRLELAPGQRRTVIADLTTDPPSIRAH